MSMKKKFENVLNKLFEIYFKEYKKIMYLTIAFILVGSLPLLYFKVTRGYIFEKDYSIKGGTLISIKTNQKYDVNAIKAHLKKYFEDFSVREIVDRISGKVISYEIIISEELSKETADKIIKKIFGDVDYSMMYQSPALGEEFFKQATIIIIISIVSMGLMVYYYFRNIASTISIMISTLSDLLLTVSFMPLLGIKLSIASFGALLMILGYSVDSDVLLSTLMVKRRDESLESRIKKMLFQEIFLDVVAFAAYLVMILFSTVDVIKNIGIVLMLGLIFDLITTLGFGYPIQRLLVVKQ